MLRYGYTQKLYTKKSIFSARFHTTFGRYKIGKYDRRLYIAAAVLYLHVVDLCMYMYPSEIAENSIVTIRIDGARSTTHM